jgi:hypothetical protein
LIDRLLSKYIVVLLVELMTTNPGRSSFACFFTRDTVFEQAGFEARRLISKTRLILGWPDKSAIEPQWIDI